MIAGRFLLSKDKSLTLYPSNSMPYFIPKLSKSRKEYLPCNLGLGRFKNALSFLK